MKKSLRLLTICAITLFAASFSLTGCSKTAAKSGTVLSGGGNNGGGGKGGGNPVPTPIPTSTVPPTSLPLAEVITTGTWKITYCVEKNDNSTADFSTYTFTFASDGTLVAKKGSTTTIGYWRSAPAIFYYGLPVYEYTSDGFFITIGNSSPLTLISKNFSVAFKGLTTFTLGSINPVEDAHVIFTKQ